MNVIRINNIVTGKKDVICFSGTITLEYLETLLNEYCPELEVKLYDYVDLSGTYELWSITLEVELAHSYENGYAILNENFIELISENAVVH